MDNPLVSAAKIIMYITSSDQGDGSDQERRDEAVKIYQEVTGASEEVAQEAISRLSNSDTET